MTGRCEMKTLSILLWCIVLAIPVFIIGFIFLANGYVDIAVNLVCAMAVIYGIIAIWAVAQETET